MIARGTAALFAHLVHYRQFRFLWAMGTTGDKCRMGLQRRAVLWLSPPQNGPRCWTAFILILVFLMGALRECVTRSLLSAYRGGVGGCLIHLEHRGRGSEGCPRALVLLYHLSLSDESPLISLLSPGCSPNAGTAATPSFAAVAAAGFNCYPHPILSDCQTDLQVRLNLYHTIPIKT